MMTKKSQIEAHVKNMLEYAKKKMEQQITKALNSGAIDVDGWEPDNNPMILPKIILISILETEAEQYKATGTCFEKQVKKEVKNLKLFL
jgi:hypothetical protein